MDPRRERRLKLVKALEDEIGKAGYDCLEVELTHEEGRPILRVVIDSLGGIGVEDCEKVSRLLGGMQEEIDPFFRGRHFLEVSSPGLERPLRKIEDFRRFQGSKARIQLKESLNGQRNFKGRIHSVESETILFTTDDGVEISFPFESVRKANLVYEGEI
ncbi:MAG: ribosome maturation factor RimP [Synergistales bacterium]